MSHLQVSEVSSSYKPGRHVASITNSEKFEHKMPDFF